MGFCVLHYDKQTGSSPGLSQHIERGCYRDGEWVEWHPTNADAERTHLNRELISGELSRDERINKRIKDAGIKKLRKDQVTALTLIMSASCEDMQRIMNEGKFDDWCRSSIKWAQDTHGEENVVSAVLHMDEKTPHLHVTVVPIVQGMSKDQIYREKKAKEAEEKGIEQKKKRKYKKKDPDTPRLCAADVMARTKLKEYQTTYANAVSEYGLERGIDGSIAKHVDINDWYRSLVTEVQELLSERDAIKAEIEEESKIKVAKDEAISTIKEFGSKMRDRISGKDKREKKKLTDKLAEATRIAKNNYAVASEEREKRISLEKTLESTSASLKAARSEINSLREAVAPAHRKADALQREIDNIKKNLPEVLPHATAMGLGIDEAVTLSSGREVHVRSIKDAEGNTLSMEGEEPIRLRWNKRIEAYLSLTWYALKEWYREALRSPWCAVNGVSNNPRRRRGMNL